MRANLITIFALVAFCLGVVLWQREQLGELRGEIDAARALATRQQPDSERITQAEKSLISSTESDFLPGSPQIDPASTIENLLIVSKREPEDDDFLSFMQRGAEMLELLKDHSADELFAILNELKEIKSEEPKIRNILTLLFMSLASMEPERTLAYLENSPGEDPSSTQQLRMMAFSAWAEADPEKALAHLGEQDWEDAEMQMAQKVVFDSLASTDLRAALDYFDTIEIHSRMMSAIVAQAAQNPARREEVWQHLNEGLDNETHQALSSGLLGAIFMEAGLAGVDEALQEMKFASPTDRDSALSGLADLAFHRSPKEALSWVQRELSPESRTEAISRSLQRWATRDVTAAGIWLKEQGPSHTKNVAISAYATTVAELDPRAALDWADEITEQESQIKTRRKVLELWHQAEPQAAAAWVDEKGLERDLWLPKG